MRIKLTVVLRTFIAAITVFLIMFIVQGTGIIMVGSAAKMDTFHLQQNGEPLYLKVVFERIYLDGEVSEEVVNESVSSLKEFWAKYDQWQLVDVNETKVTFRKNVDDISPLLKANGFFGVTHEGVLSIFNGKPERSRIIQSFFQIDIKKLESKKQEELIHGIPIKTKDHYVEVLETFKPYSTNDLQGN
ncbi:BofC C-terminal domain-containing protein [Neobacillus sp. PS3-40]|jgi:forespore regulator of the sigma-K checkpoint|uniref:BofC C-terminal domain-containing protein n=1 Tax=Neobacillus sp. PS3-40 TaxID=3070679 RepID=UPI0027DF3927|nr:BofC C-terminal domain-containing protein [Neobacillus sp. PS3-40]WML45524.1 BofC C-terminal domain-containing protein [Neobacillus sp. PS3-40]